MDKPAVKPKVKLIGEDSNVFNVISRVVSTLEKAGQAKEAKEFFGKAFNASSYGEVLRLCRRYCEIE